MTPKPKGIAARAGHWSARHRKTAIFGWLGLIIALFMIGGSVGQKQPTDAQKADGDSRKAMQIYEDAGFEKKTSEMVLVQSKTKTVDDPAFQAAVADVTKTVSKQSVVTNVTSDAVSEDRRSALVQFDLKGDPETATERIQPVMDATKSVATRHSGLAIEQYGDASLTEVDGRPVQGRGRQLAVHVVRHDAADPRAHVRRARGRLRAGPARA